MLPFDRLASTSSVCHREQSRMTFRFFYRIIKTISNNIKPYRIKTCVSTVRGGLKPALMHICSVSSRGFHTRNKQCKLRCYAFFVV